MTERLSNNPEPDEFDYSALGYTLHNLYNSLESYFLRIAKFFENNIDKASWHKDLINRMMLEIEGYRPALFDRDFAAKADELRCFRHVFRSLYQSSLQPERVLLVNKRVANIDNDFKGYHLAYIDFLDRLYEEYGK